VKILPSACNFRRSSLSFPLVMNYSFVEPWLRVLRSLNEDAFRICEMTRISSPDGIQAMNRWQTRARLMEIQARLRLVEYWRTSQIYVILQIRRKDFGTLPWTGVVGVVRMRKETSSLGTHIMLNKQNLGKNFFVVKLPIFITRFQTSIQTSLTSK